MRRRLLRWGHPLLLFLVAAASLAVLVLDYRRMESAFESAVAELDNLTQARLHVAQALLAAERIRDGDPTLPPSRPDSELDQALALLDDLAEGRSSLLQLESKPLDPTLTALLSDYRRGLERLRRDLRGGNSEDPVGTRVRAAALDDAAGLLEREMYAALRQRLEGEETRHRIRVAAWLLFLVLAGTMFSLVQRARDQSEEAFHAAERRYAALATHAAAELVRTDAEGRIIEGTDGWGEPDLGGRDWWDLLPSTERNRAAGIWTARATRRVPFYLEVRHENSDGTARWLVSRWALDEQGPSPSWVGTFMDETEHRAIEDQLRQVERLDSVGRLASGLAHDFNNILSVILTNVELLKGRLDAAARDSRDSPDFNGPRASELMNEIGDAAEGGRALVADLMGFSRTSTLEMEPENLAELVERHCRLARRLLPDSVTLALHVEDHPLVYADGRALQQILLNLVSNAGDAMPDGGRVRVEVDTMDVDEKYLDAHPWVEMGNFGRITVSDTGVGMDAATLERIFDPFFTTKAEGKGTGLGLATVHGLVRQHGGHVHAYSEPGEGTTVRVYFPRADAAGRGTEGMAGRVEERASGQVAEGVVPGAGGRRSGSKLRVLLVDDDDALRRSAKRLLVRLGHEVLDAASGREALKLMAGGEAFDVVISDVTMDDIGGVELFHALRARGRAGAFVLTSGYPPEEMAARGKLPEGAAYLAKPWTVEELEEALASVA